MVFEILVDLKEHELRAKVNLLMSAFVILCAQNNGFTWLYFNERRLR